MNINQKLKPQGFFTLKHFRNDVLLNEEKTSNIVVTEGLDYIGAVSYGAYAKQNTWYLALFGDNTTPLANDTASGTNIVIGSGGSGTGVALRLGEIKTEIDEAVRPTWTPDSGNDGASSSNSIAPAEFTIATGTTDLDVYGGFMVSSNVQTGAAGVLLAAAKFTTARVVQADDVLQLTYTIELT